MDNTIDEYPKKSKNQKEIVPKTPEMYNLYTTHLKQIFENINYYIAKNNPYYKEIHEKTEIYLKKLAVDYELNGDKYIPIIIKSLYIENYKLAKNVLPNMNILIKYNFILGKNYITKYITELSSFLIKDIKTFTKENIFDKKLLDLLIIILTHLDEIYHDEDIWFYLSECLSEMIYNNYIINNIYGKSFKKIYEFFFRVYNKLEKDEKRQKKIRNDLIYFINHESNLFSQFYNSEINEQFNDVKSYSYYLKQIYNKLDTVDCIENSKKSNYNSIDLFVCRTVKYMIDTICLRFEGQKNNNINYNENNEIKILSLVPQKESDFNKMTFRYLLNIRILDDHMHYSSYFGWCYICRKPASYYCIKYYLPICSFQCKYLLQNEEDDLNNFNFSLVKDCAKMFEFFSKILSDKKFLPNQKNMVFGLIEEMISKSGKVFKHSKIFRKIVKDYLMDSIVKTSLSKEQILFMPSIKMFFDVWKLFKKSIKKEIYYYNENVLIKIINSSNASFLHKKIVFEFFIKQDFFYFLELYINYDFDINENFLIYNLISSLSDIIKGRFYTNSKNNINYTEKENLELINYSLKILTFLLHCILDYSNKIFSLKKENKNNKKKNSRKSLLLYTLSVDNKKNIFSEKKGREFNKLSINNINKEYSNKTYRGINTEINYLEKNDNNIIKLNENKIKDLFSTQKIEQVNPNINKNYDLKKNSEFEIALTKFNIKYEYGLSYLKTLGYINISSLENEAKDIIHFFKEMKNINKINLFKFLGENNRLSSKVLEIILDEFNFNNLDIVQAIKLFFGMNITPLGIGEKFENILRAFSKKYCKDNINTHFENEENIFYLSYAISKLISSKGKKKKKDFIQLINNIMNNNGKNFLPVNFLENIYNQIIKEFDFNYNNIDINLKNISRIKYNFDSNINYKEKAYKTIEKEDIGEYLFQLILLIWKKLTVTCNIIIEESNEESIYKKGISGIVYLVQILGIMELEQQKQTAIALICFMSNLLQIKTLKEKNIFCIKQILFLANGDYRFCKGGWDSILKIINKLHFYYLFDSMPKNEKEDFIKKYKNISYEKENLEKLPKIFSPIDYEKIFYKSYNFDSDTLIEFMQSMCEIARKEFIEDGLTKTFFLEKIVEIAENNLFVNKKGININQIWKILSHFFIKIGSLNNTENSITCVDSLRQLVSNFLTKKECNENKFQNELFKPFLQIINISKNNETKEYIYSCMNSLIKTHIENIKYGWVTVINIYKELYYINDLNSLKIQVLDIFVSISEKYFGEISGVLNNFISFLKLYIPSYPIKATLIVKILFQKINNENNYKSVLKLYMNFLINEEEEIRNKSIENFNYYISKEYISQFIFLKDIYKKESFWKTVFNEILYKSLDYLSQKISEFICNSTINIINSISNTNTNINSSVSESFTDISSYKSLNVKGARNNTSEKLKYTNTLQNLLKNTTNIFDKYFNHNYKEFPNYLNCLEKIIFFDDEKVQKIGIQSIKYLAGLEKINNKFFLQNLIKFFISILNKSSGEELSKLNYKDIISNSGSKIFIHNIERNIFLSHIHYNISFILDSSFPKIISNLKIEEITKLIDMFYLSYFYSLNFNSKIKLRLAISELLKINSTINLFQQFQLSIKNYFYLLEYIYSNVDEGDNKINIKTKIFVSAEKLLDDYIKKENESRTFFEINNKEDENIEKEYQEKEIFLNYYVVPLCENVFPIIKKVKFYEDDKYKDIFSKIFLTLISCESIKIRENIKELLNIVFNVLFEEK